MPRQKSLLTVIEDIVRREIASAMAVILDAAAPSKNAKKQKAKNGRRKKRRPGRPKGSKNKPKA